MRVRPLLRPDPLSAIPRKRRAMYLRLRTAPIKTAMGKVVGFGLRAKRGQTQRWQMAVLGSRRAPVLFVSVRLKPAMRHTAATPPCRQRRANRKPKADSTARKAISPTRAILYRQTLAKQPYKPKPT